MQNLWVPSGYITAAGKVVMCPLSVNSEPTIIQGNCVQARG